VLSQKEGGKHFHRESYGRFSSDLKQTDSASLGWNDFMNMDAFLDVEQGYLQVWFALQSASCHHALRHLFLTCTHFVVVC
jgi:hypothetical protein